MPIEIFEAAIKGIIIIFMFYYGVLFTLKFCNFILKISKGKG